MESANTTCEVLLLWWNFSGVSESNQAVLVQEVRSSGLDGSTDDSDSLNPLAVQLEDLGAVPIDTAESKHVGSDYPLSILDRYLEEHFDFDALEKFEACLVTGDSFFRVTTESGKSHTGPLSHLCSIRLASLVALQPNWLFFFLPDEPDPLAARTVSILFDLRAILPTLSARAWRQNVGHNPRPIAVSKAHLFLFGNYLPEFIGNIVAVESSSSKDLLGGGATLAHEELPITSLNRLGNSERTPLHFQFVRLPLLALAAAAKKFAKNKSFSSKWFFWAQRLLVGPTSSQRLMGRDEYRRLTRLIQPKLGRKCQR